MNYENYTFAEAIKLLADRAGIALPEIEDSKEAREKENRRKTLLQINKEAATYFIISCVHHRACGAGLSEGQTAQ